LRNRRGTEISEEMKFHHPLTLRMANTMAVSSFRQDIARIISPDQPLLPQIWSLNHEQYMRLVYSPHWLFVPSPRMFETDFMESFSHVKWWTVPILPLLVITYLFRQVENWNSLNPAVALLICLAGFLSFTFTEYFLHRFIFHSENYLPDSRLARYIHFFTHGVHHMLPNDP
jgi:4-hydroxysphinganine ceramide fatty acyl 2-hydroxylase